MPGGHGEAADIVTLLGRDEVIASAACARSPRTDQSAGASVWKRRDPLAAALIGKDGNVVAIARCRPEADHRTGADEPG
jgi:hypothetical protein